MNSLFLARFHGESMLAEDDRVFLAEARLILQKAGLDVEAALASCATDGAVDLDRVSDCSEELENARRRAGRIFRYLSW